MLATVNRWPASEAGHRGARCGKRVYRGGRYESPAAVNTIYHGGLFKLPATVKT